MKIVLIFNTFIFLIIVFFKKFIMIISKIKILKKYSLKFYSLKSLYFSYLKKYVIRFIFFLLFFIN